MVKQIIDPALALRIVRESQRIAYDTETTGLDFLRDAVCGYVITDYDHSVYVPVRHGDGGNIVDVEDFERALVDAFRERSRLGYRTIGHHLNFDLTMGSKHGVVPFAPLEDTQLNEGLIDDNTVGYGLDDCAARYGVPAKRGAELYAELARRFGGVPDRKQMQHFWRMPGDHPLVVDYATGDGITTLALCDAQQRSIDEQELRRVWQLECDLIPYVARIKTRGIKVDQKLAEQMIGENGTIAKALKEAKAKLPPGINVNSPKEVEQLYRDNGYEDHQFKRTAPTKNKPDGQVSFTEKWLQQNEIGEAILQVRRLVKLETSFVAPLVDASAVTGRVHATLNQSRSDEYGTNTGRFSCSDPNLQAYPKRNKVIGKLVRPLVIPDNDCEMGEADFKQQEPRLFAHYSEDEGLLGGYLMDPPRDIHATVMELLHKDRDTAKRLGMGMLTGMQVPSLAGHMGYSKNDAQRDWDAFMSAMPGIKAFQQLAKATAIKRGYVKTILGRRARFPSKQYAYRATSRIIQGTGADHMKTALLLGCQYCEAEDWIIEILMTIHDSNIFQYPKGDEKRVTELVRIIESVPQRPEFNLLVPIPVDIGRGSNWSEASYGK